MPAVPTATADWASVRHASAPPSAVPHPGRGRRRALAPAAVLAAASVVLTGCGTARDVLDAAAGAPPRTAEAVVDGARNPAALAVPPTSGGAVPRAAARPVAGPRPPSPPRRPRSPSPPTPPGEDAAPRFEPPRPSNAPSPAYRPACPQDNDGTTSVPSRIRGGAGALTLTFWNPGARDAVRLDVTARAVSLRAGTQPEPPAVTVPAPRECRDVTATVTGLRPGRYQVWIEMTTRSPLDGRLRTEVVGRTEAVTVT